MKAARENPGFVEVADPGPDTVYRAGTLALEEEIGIDLTPKSHANKAPTQAVYDAETEAALVPLDAVVLSDVLAGELEALAVLGDGRCRNLPDIPTAKDLGHDVVVPVFGGGRRAGRDAPEDRGRVGEGLRLHLFLQDVREGAGRFGEGADAAGHGGVRRLRRGASTTVVRG